MGTKRILLAAAITSFVAVALPSPAQIPKKEFRIVFDKAEPSYDSRGVGLDVDVFVTSPWSDSTKRLTRDHRSHSPSWSPDGRQIAFIRDERPVKRQSGGSCDVAGSLFRMDAHGKNVTRIAGDAGGNVVETTWLPDGTTLALRSAESERGTACSEEPVVLLTDGERFEAFAGQKMTDADQSSRAPASNTQRARELFCPPVDNKRPAIVEELTRGAIPVPKSGRESPRDSKLESDFWNSIPFPPDRTAKLKLFSLERKGGILAPTNAYDAQWSPDGKRIVYSRFAGSENAVLFVADVMDGQLGNERRLTSPDLDAHEASWSSDGSRIAFAGYWGHGQQIFVMNTDGTGLTRLGQGEGKGLLGSNPSLTCTHPSWSPDGKLMVAECREEQMTSSVDLCRNVYGLYTSIYLFDVEKPQSIPHRIVDCSYESSNPDRLYSYQAKGACGAHNPSFAPVGKVP